MRRDRDGMWWGAAPVTVAVLVVAEACFAPAAYAAEQTALEEIVVTARKREESLQDTPISVSAFTGAAIERQHIQQLDGIAAATPNMMFDTAQNFSGSSSAASVFIRGIGQVDFTLTTEPGVGVYLDGVYLSQSIGGVLNLVDVERIEVLRGPQGTLFGRNTIGGAINITSKKPDDTLHGSLEVVTGSYDRIDARGSVNVPVTPTLFAKVSAATFNRDGFLSAPNTPDGEPLGDVNEDVARVALRFVPNDRFEADFAFDYTRERENGVPHVLASTFEGASLALIGSLANPASPDFLPPPAPLPAPSFVDLHNILATAPIGQQGGIAGITPGVVPNPVFGQPTIGAADVQDFDGDPDGLFNGSTLDLASESDIWGVALTWSYDFDWVTVKSITSYRETEARTGYDIDALPILIGDLIDEFDVDQLSQEVQLSGTAFDGRMNWLVGFYHFEEDGINLDDVEFTPARFLSGAKIDNRSTAAFTQVTFDVTPKLSVTGGLRFTDESKKFILDDECLPLPKGPATLFDGTVVTCTPLQTVIDPKFLNAGFLTFVNAPVFPAPGGRLCCLPISDAQGNVVGLVPGLTPGFELLPRGTTEESFSELNPHASIAYRWTDDFMTYFSFSEGFKSGGFVQRVFPPKIEVPSFDPETAQVFEVGFKWTGFDRRVRVSASGFHTDYEDLHIQVNDGIAPVTRNAGSADVDGFEIEVTALPAAGWLVDASVGYLDAGYSELPATENLVTDLRTLTLDSDLVNAPEWSTHLGVQYARPMPFGGELIGRIDWSFVDEVAKDALNFPELIQDGYHLLDLHLTYVSADERWEVSAFAKNVLDEHYIVSGFSNGLTQGRGAVTVGRPAEWGLSARYRFGQ